MSGKTFRIWSSEVLDSHVEEVIPTPPILNKTSTFFYLEYLNWLSVVPKLGYSLYYHQIKICISMTFGCGKEKLLCLRRETAPLICDAAVCTCPLVYIFLMQEKYKWFIVLCSSVLQTCKNFFKREWYKPRWKNKFYATSYLLILDWASLFLKSTLDIFFPCENV